MELKLATTRTFNGNELACYTEEHPQEKWDFWATREQIGKFLGYDKPRRSIANIHNRNKERLDKFSRVIKMVTHEEKRDVVRDFTVYSFKGLLEICRFSAQPNANKVIDILWDVAYEIASKGYYVHPAVQLQIDEMRKQNDLLREKVTLLEGQNQALLKHIQDNSSFTLLGQAITPVKAVVSFGEGAKLFSQHGIKTGQNRLFKTARETKMLAKRKGRQHNQPTQWAIDKGYCVLIVPFGQKGTPYLTMKGLQFLADVLAKGQYPLLALMADCEALNE